MGIIPCYLGYFNTKYHIKGKSASNKHTFFHIFQLKNLRVPFWCGEKTVLIITKLVPSV